MLSQFISDCDSCVVLNERV